ncbi:type III-D CRISPR-associated protein Csx19 [Streptomyces sp. NPDC004838]
MTHPVLRSNPTAAVRLHSLAAEPVGFQDALAHARLAGAVALLSTPQAFVIATVHDDHRCSTADTPAGIPLDDVFEARVFTPHTELRWMATGTGSGRAVILTEDDSPLPTGPFTEEITPLTAIDTIESRYLLWGRPLADDRAPDGWTTLHTPRIGVLHIPTPAGAPPLSASDRMQLVAREYVCAEPRHGNAYIAEERLLRLDVTGPRRREKADG